MSMSTSIDDMLVADLPPFDVKLSKKMLSLLGMEVQPLPRKLVADKREKVTHARWVVHGKRSQKTQDEAPNNGVGTISFSAKDADDELLSGCFDLMKDIFDPRHMTADMLQTLHGPMEGQYIWPSHTIGTFVELVKEICGGSNNNKRLIFGLLDQVFSSRNISRLPHLQNRMIALRTEVSLRAYALDPAIDVDYAFKKTKILYQSLQKVSFSITPLNTKLDLFAPRGGVFEPSLALALIRNDNVLESLLKINGKWAKAQDEKEPVNLLYEFLTERGAFAVQIIDNIKFTQKNLEVEVILPTLKEDRKPRQHYCLGKDSKKPAKTDKVPRHPPLSAFKYCLLIDVQQCEIVSEPVKLRKILQRRQYLERKIE